MVDPLEPPADRVARLKKERLYYESHQEEFERLVLLPVEKMYEIPGTPSFLSVSDTWKINSTVEFFNVTTFHLYLRMEGVRPVKKFWLSWCFQKPMRERDMPKCSSVGADPAFCR